MVTILWAIDFIWFFGPAIYFCVALVGGVQLKLAQSGCDCITFVACTRRDARSAISEALMAPCGAWDLIGY
jgi:hypothetical protein